MSDEHDLNLETNGEFTFDMLKHVPAKPDQIEEFVRSLYKSDENIDMKTIYASPVDIARLHVIKEDFANCGLTIGENILKTFLEVFKPASVSKNGIGRDQAKEMVAGLLAKKLSFSEKIIQNLAKEE